MPLGTPMLGELRRHFNHHWQQPIKRTAFLLGLGLGLLIIDIVQLSFLQALGVMLSSLVLAIPVSSVLLPAAHLAFSVMQRQPTALKVSLLLMGGLTSFLGLVAYFEVLFHLGLVCASLIGLAVCAALIPHATDLKNFMLHQALKLKDNNPFIFVMSLSSLFMIIKGVSLLNAMGVLTLGAIATLVVYPVLRFCLEKAWQFAKNNFNALTGRRHPIAQRHSENLDHVREQDAPVASVVEENRPLQVPQARPAIVPLAQNAMSGRQRPVLVSQNERSASSNASPRRSLDT